MAVEKRSEELEESEEALAGEELAEPELEETVEPEFKKRQSRPTSGSG